MRYIILILLTVAVQLVMAQSKRKSTFEISIEQGDLSYSIGYSDTLLTLKPEPFTIKFTLYKIEGVYVSTSLSNEYYYTPQDGDIPDWANISSKVMAEEDFNSDKDINVDSEFVSYWYYDKSSDWYRMDEGSLKIKRKKVSGTYTVNKLYLVETEKDIVVSDFHDILYLFFFSATKTERNTLGKVLEKRRIRLKFLRKT